MNLVEKVQILNRCGYSDQEIAEFIRKHREVIIKRPNAIDEERFGRITQSLQQLGFTVENVRKMWLKFYDLTYIVTEDLKQRYDNLRALGFTPDGILKMWSEFPDQSIFTVENINEKFNNLLAKGFTKEQVAKMWSDFPRQSGFSVEIIDEKINNLLAKGFTREQVVAMWSEFPQQSGLSVENINEKFNNLLTQGFTKQQVVGMWSKFPEQLGLSVETINEKIHYFLDKGFIKEQLVKMWSKSPQQISLSIENVNEKFNNLLAKGLDKEQIVAIWSKFPQQISLSVENVNEKFNNFLAKGLDKEQVVAMWSQYTSLVKFSIVRTDRLLELCQKNDLMDLIVKHPNNFAISPDLLEARINFCKDQKLTLERWAFISNKNFSERFKLTREELIEKFGNKTPETDRTQSVNIEAAKGLSTEVATKKIEATNQSSLQKQPASNVSNHLKELEARERKIVQELKNIVQEETAKTELGYNQQTLKVQELELKQRKDKLTETVQKFYQESNATKITQQDLSEALSKEVGRLERELKNLEQQQATYKEWKKNYKVSIKSMPLDEQIKKYGKNPRCKELLAELKQVREDKQEILMSNNKDINHQSTSKRSDWGIN